MTRISLVLLLAPLYLVGAPALADTPTPHKPHARHVPHAASPAPRVPASARVVTRPDGLLPAPVPNQDILAPVEREDRDPHVTPTLFRLTNDFRGDGYVYGSSPQGMDDKRALTIPGVKLAVPLQ